MRNKHMAKVSLFIGQVQALPVSGRPTAMYKKAVEAPIELSAEGFVGDEQSDRRVHGGPEKAVHLYPSAHYAKLAAQFPDVAPLLVPGSIGENIATEDLDEHSVRLGDVWQLGSALIQVCQPRNPCWKIDERFACEGMTEFIANERLTGWYWRVVTPGLVAPGDSLEIEQAASEAFTLAEAMRHWQAHRPALADLEKLAATPGIAENWKQKITTRLDWLRKNPQATPPQPVAFHVKPESP